MKRNPSSRLVFVQFRSAFALFLLLAGVAVALGAPSFQKALHPAVNVHPPKAPSGAPPPAVCPPEITQSATQTITQLNSVSCNDGVGHTDNSYWRAFDMAALTGGQQYDVTSVSFGVESASPAQSVTVNLYTTTDFPVGFPGSLTLIGSTTANVGPGDNGSVVTTALSATVPAGTSQLVMELFTPDGTGTGNLFFVGSNADPQTGPSYLSAASCGVTAPTDTAAISFPNMHIVFSVNGSCLSCTPGDIIVDGGFEETDEGGFNPNWDSTSTAFDSSLCTGDLCGGPYSRSGDGWVWFDGTGNGIDAEDGTASQSVTFPLGGTVSLSYYLWLAEVNAPALSVMTVEVDGTVVETVNEPAAPDDDYVLHTVDLSAFADGAAHEIKFAYSRPGLGGDRAALAAGGNSHIVRRGRPAGEVPSDSFFVDDVVLDVMCPGEGLPNDDCPGAIPIDCDQTIKGDTTSATIDDVPFCGTILNTAPGVWYKFTGDGSQVTLDTCGFDGFDTKLGVFTGSCGNLNCITGNDDFCGLQSQVTFNTVVGTEYLVLVTGFSSNAGQFELRRTCTPLAPVTLTTRVNADNISLGEETFDIAMLSGAVEPVGGTITFRLYGPNDDNCTGTPIFTSIQVVDGGNGEYSSTPFTPTANGVYRWVASYSGSDGNAAYAGECNDPNENVTVSAATPTPSPTPLPGPVQALNLSTRMRVLTGDGVGIGGFIINGAAPKRLLIRGIGPSLSRFGLEGFLLDTTLELHGPGGFITIMNDNWQDTDGPAIAATGIPPIHNLESAILITLPPGPYTAIVAGKNGTVGLGLVEVYDLDPGANSKLVNISTRAFADTGSNLMIAGFILGGTNTLDAHVVIRGIGPSLTAQGVSNALADPSIELRNGHGTLLASNDDWQEEPGQATEVSAAGLAPTNTVESAISAHLPRGAYTVLMTGQNGGIGNGLVEVYQVADPEP